MKLLRIAAVLVAIWLGGCSESKQPFVPDTSAEPRQLHGKVVGLKPRDSIAIIRHEKIDGWMEAMTMEFLVTDEKGFESLHSGDRVTATVMVGKQKFWISEIHREF